MPPPISFVFKMVVDLLDAPLRVSWDLCGVDSHLRGDQLQVVAQRLVNAGVFYVTLEASPLRHPAIIFLLEELTAGGCQVALSLDGCVEEMALLADIPGSVSLFIDCAAAISDGRFKYAALQQTLEQLRSADRDAALLWIPRHAELPLLLELLDFCAAESVQRFKLPNHKIGVNSEPADAAFLPDCNDLEQLAKLIEVTGIPEVPDLQLEVHDLFLWELLQPLSGGQRSEYGGCQAANSLAHIAANGHLYPCSSWPENIGDLLKTDLLDLWQSQQRLEIREQISRTPVGCEGCRDYQICFGGCRGLANFCRDDGLKRDLLCAARR